MKIIRLTLTFVFAVYILTALIEVRGAETQKNNEKNDAKIEAEQQSLSCDTDSRFSCNPHSGIGHHTGYTPCVGNHDPNETCQNGRNHIACHDGPCVDGHCKDGTCRKCNGSCPKICPVHGKDCQNDCLKNQQLNNQFGYGAMQVCPGKTNGICPVHGYAPCPHPGLEFGQFLRQTFRPADRPYWGTQPLYIPREHYDPGFQPRFPRVRALLLVPPAPAYMTTVPPVPMPTYTTRGPRDFLNPNPPGIGY
ncbi:MAG: hypothetical protein LBC02_03120 [Planctomycetaceae bacterium]|jgi:hypothetical protein|nr:hypothetical protein [Planctomycetaceae bacterium]